MKQQIYLAYLASFFVAIFLVACGEQGVTENITQVNQASIEVVTDVSKLPKCGKSNNEELVWVKNEATPRMCTNGKWYAIAEGSVAATCSTKPLKDSSGVKIICGGDSVGVVLNGKDGVDGKNGKDGAQGAQGVQGEKGDTGAQGKQGVQGEKGDKGDTGAQGKQGVQGEKGDKGDTGAQGKQGEKGDTGAAGKDGVAGKDGTNGKDGASGAAGKDGKNGSDGASCFIENIDELMVRVICGADSTILYVGKAPDTTAQDTVELDSEKIAISLNEVSGVTQKGPFLNGSKVLVREMEDGRTLTQTGNSFNGKILNDKGEFVINARMLVSQYVMLEATGYYRNEVTGENSNSELTLFAITDVNDRNVVNVNLLTHLEYERVIYLVTQKKMKVRTAKKQAQKEVFNLIHIDATNFSNSEDLNMVGSSDEDGALLAFSVLLQGDRSVADLSELLTKIATDMEKDGVWNDAATRFAIADWAADADSAGRLAVIRENVKNWGISAMVPNFEKYVHHFWVTEYALDTCNASRVGVVDSAHMGPRGKTATRFICKEVDDDEMYRWFMASDFEKDTYGWKDTTDGAIKYGNVTDSIYVFDETGSNGNKGWRVADRTESQYGGCSAKRYGNVVGDRWYGGFFQCQEATHRWEPIGYDQHLLIETNLWQEGDDGFSKWGEIWTGSSERHCYVYDTSSTYKGWRDGNEYDCSLGLMGCTKGRLGLLRKTENGDFYTCVEDGGYNGYSWRQVTDRVAFNTDGWPCLDSNDGVMRKGKESDAYFVCIDNAWRETTPEEERNCLISGICRLNRCTARKRGGFDDRDSGLYVCDCEIDSWANVNLNNCDWRLANIAEKKVGSLCTANDSAVIWDLENFGNFKIDYICSNNYWHPVYTPLDYTLTDWNKKKTENFTSDAHPDAVFGKDLVDKRDGNVYKTVIIGGKRWMAENLRFADSLSDINYRRGMAFSCVSIREYSWSEWECDECERAKSHDQVGTVYSWTAAMDLDSKWANDFIGAVISLPRRGICPEGWHLPDTTEWKILAESVDYVSLQMKGFYAWPNATNTSGFSVVPMKFEGLANASASYWTATECIPDDNCMGSSAYIFSISNDGSFIKGWERDPGAGKKSVLSVRCVEDDPVKP